MKICKTPPHQDQKFVLNSGNCSRYSMSIIATQLVTHMIAKTPATRISILIQPTALITPTTCIFRTTATVIAIVIKSKIRLGRYALITIFSLERKRVKKSLIPVSHPNTIMRPDSIAAEVKDRLTRAVQSIPLTALFFVPKRNFIPSKNQPATTLAMSGTSVCSRSYHQRISASCNVLL